ncbi:hypothetical protein PybrP1_009070 [[Pythium] brassicae (nom. inval.)]|nr:hypothetical protein PybrP1_009070 [[Pythium] brassicae (nom. inval.)]
MSSARGKPVDYSDFYLEEGTAKPRKRSEDDFSDDDGDVPLKLAKPKPVGGKSTTIKNKGDAAVVKKPVKKAEKGAGKKSKKRVLDDSNSDSNEATARAKKPKQKRRDADDKPVEIKRKSKVAEGIAKEKASARSNGGVVPKPVKKATAESPLPWRAPTGSSEELSEAAAFRKKYEALRDLRETESERLLQDAKELALEEKKTYERMIAKLKKEVSALSSRLQDGQREHEKEIEKLQTENQLRLESLERKFAGSDNDDHGLRRRVKELEAQLSDARRHNKPTARASARAAGETAQLAQATKLLEIYRLVTSTDIRLIETPEDDADDVGYTDISCTTTDSITGRQFHFDLGVPGDDDDEIEYLPSETPSKDVKVPSYFQEEMSFTRSEMTKFMRTILDVVIRKKAPDARAGR